MALIAILDDDRDIRDLMRLTLEREGHEVAQPESMGDMDQLLQSRSIDLLLLDIVLPEGDGLQYLERHIGNAKTKHIPVILVSALRQKKKIVDGLKAGAIDYITKPFDMVELKVRVTSALKVHDLRNCRDANEELEATRETARTIQYEIQLPMNEIQRSLIQLRSEIEDFNTRDQQSVEEAWLHFSKLEEILSSAESSGTI